MSLAPLMGFGVHAQYLNDCSQVQIEDSLMIFVEAWRAYFVQHVWMLDVYWFLCVFAEKKKGWDRGGGKICSAYEFFSWLFLLGSLAGIFRTGEVGDGSNFSMCKLCDVWKEDSCYVNN